jgi:hypothetical protein
MWCVPFRIGSQPLIHSRVLLLYPQNVYINILMQSDSDLTARSHRFSRLSVGTSTLPLSTRATVSGAKMTGT